jgi:hypothetical protein
MSGQRGLGGTGATYVINTPERRSHVYLHLGTLNDPAPFGIIRDYQ